MEADVDFECTSSRVACLPGDVSIYVVGGFFGGGSNGVSLLGRGGSDYSAAVFAAVLGAEQLEIWTDVDGVYTADPRIVPEAFSMPTLSYAEAAELSHFGAKVLHPKTVAPVKRLGIPIRVCDSFHPELPGTVVSSEPGTRKFPVCGVTCLPEVVLINIPSEGEGLQQFSEILPRIKDRVVFLTHATSEFSVSVAVKKEVLAEVLEVVSHINVSVIPDLSLVSLVGEEMRSEVGVASTFFSALSKAGVNVFAIAQGSSERNISAVVHQSQMRTAVRAVHQKFFAPAGLEIYLAGLGVVGTEVLNQLKELQTKHPSVKVCGISNSAYARTSAIGIDLESPYEPTEFADRRDWLRAPSHGYERVFVDCTSSEDVSFWYVPFLEEGFHVVTANKKANSGDFGYYQDVREAAASSRTQFLYETNVGAGLPVIDTIRRLTRSGDSLIRFEGVLSGSLSFLCGALEDGVSFTSALQKARTLGFTEPDPRDDLSGMDVARKLVILAREFGVFVELNQVVVSAFQDILPEFDSSGSVEQFMENSKLFDDLDLKGYRFIASIEEGVCSVGLKKIDSNHPLYSVREGENAFCFWTTHYNPKPLVIRGYGAGAVVTAAGVLADVMSLVDAR